MVEHVTQVGHSSWRCRECDWSLENKDIGSGVVNDLPTEAHVVGTFHSCCWPLWRRGGKWASRKKHVELRETLWLLESSASQDSQKESVPPSQAKKRTTKSQLPPPQPWGASHGSHRVSHIAFIFFSFSINFLDPWEIISELKPR